MKRVFAAGLVLAALHVGVTLARALAIEHRPPSMPARPTVLPAAEGPILRLGIQFHRAGAETFLPVFAAILSALSPSTTVHVVVGDAEDRDRFQAAHAEWFRHRAGPRMRYAVAKQPITSWMRDRLAVRAVPEHDRPFLLAPATAHTGPAPRVGDWQVPWVLARHFGVDGSVERARYRFDGGDIIADRERVYVAQPLFDRNPGVTPAKLASAITADLGRPVLRLGTTGDVPDHHIGMFVTPLGGGRVAVGDPDLALEAVGAARNSSGALELDAGDEVVRIDVRPRRLERFRRVIRELQAAGLQVVRIPILPATDPFVFLSYNNVLCDARDGGLHVLMPTYGIPRLDRLARDAWERAGARVTGIDVRGVFRLGGSVRCLVAPLARGR